MVKFNKLLRHFWPNYNTTQYKKGVQMDAFFYAVDVASMIMLAIRMQRAINFVG